MALVAAVALNAATQVTFDFSDASAYGYANPAQGAYTTLPTGSTLTKDGVVITVAYSTGNGFRFTSNQNTGVINFRGYVNASFTIAAPQGKKLAAIAADGLNLTSQYLSDGMTSSDWSSETGVESLTTNVIKSTVQFNSMVVTLIEDGEVPPTHENIKVDVAGAIAAGMALDSTKTSTDVYDVTGFVVDAQAFSKDHGNQIWFMADDAANTGEQVFEAYACTVSENNTLMQVLNGDKVTLTGKITKYYDKTNKKFIIEIKNGTAVFISKAEGDHSIDGGAIPGGDTTLVPLDTITVAKALEIGQALAEGAQTEKQYVIAGYSSSIETKFDAQYGNETFWMADSETSEAASNADSAFYVYRGTVTPAEEMGVHAKIYVTSVIKKYMKSGVAIIETNGKVNVNVVKKGVIETPDTITVAKALEIGGQLAAGSVSAKEYVIKGYVSSIQEYFSEQYKNETFWITDTKGDRTSDKTKAFEVYRGKPNTEAEIGLEAYIQIQCKIKNFNGTIENDGSNIVFEVLEQGLPVGVDTISVAKALEIGQALADSAYTDNPYVVIGYVTKAYAPAEGKKTQNFYMADEPNVRGEFYAYNASPDSTIKDGDYVQLFGKIQKYVGSKGVTIELSYGTATHLEAPAPDVEDTISVAQALEIAKTMTPEAGKSDTTEVKYAVKGYIVATSSSYENTWTMADEAGVSGEFQAFECYSVDSDVTEGDLVIVVGYITTVNGGSFYKYQIKAGILTHVYAEGIENVTLTEKAQKVMMDGVMYIIRNGKMYNVQGAQVR